MSVGGFACFERALVRRPDPRLGEGLTTAALGAPDFALALTQHDAYLAALVAAGVAVEVLPAAGHPDGHFVEDTALVFLPGHGIKAVVDGRTVVIGRRCFVGLSGRTDSAGIEALAAAIEPLGYSVEAVPVGGGLHLKSGVNALDAETLLAVDALADRACFDGFRVLRVPAAEEIRAMPETNMTGPHTDRLFSDARSRRWLN